MHKIVIMKVFQSQQNLPNYPCSCAFLKSSSFITDIREEVPGRDQLEEKETVIE